MVNPNNKGLPLTGEQRRFLETAAEEGYFKVPRETTIRDLADEHGMTSQEGSELLRNAVDTLVTKEVLEE